MEISTKAIDLNNIILLARSFKNSPQLFILDNVVKEGYLVGDIILNFDDKGKIKDDYVVNGFIKQGKASLLGKYSIDNLNLSFQIKNKEYHFTELKTFVNQIKLSSPSITIKEKNDKFFINGKLINNKASIDTKVLYDFFENSFENHTLEEIILSTDSNFEFTINKKFKINNFQLKSTIDLTKLIYKNNLLGLENYLPKFKNLIELEDHLISINYKAIC